MGSADAKTDKKQPDETVVPPTAGDAAEASPAPAPAPAAEAAAVAPPAPAAAPAKAPSTMLDLAFCCDCTGSMGAYIRSAQDNIRAIAENIHAAKGQQCQLRYALVKYRDHPPQDTSFVTEVYPFTKSLEVMKGNIDTMAASGGGDGPEAVTAGMHEVLNLNWREEASKVCVFIADAPPHGLGESGDGFPNGDPDGRDPIVIAKAMAEKGIAVYSVGVEPVLSTQYKFARDFMMMVASVTGGKFLPLGKADILSKVVVSTALEGLAMEQLWGDLEEEIKREAAAKKEEVSTEVLCARVEAAVAEKAKEVKMRHVKVANPYMDERYDMANCDAFTKATSLAGARGHLSASKNVHVAQETAAYAWSAQVDDCCDADMDMEQVSRACVRGATKAKAKK